MKKFLRLALKLLAVICIIWSILTFWAESEGASRKLEIGDTNSVQTALIVYDPDPFYNLDQQVCEAFALGLQENGWKVTIATVAAVKEINPSSFQLYVFCANTYNWAPDWAVTRFIKNQSAIKNKNVVAITLGAGSTGLLKKFLKILLKKEKEILLIPGHFGCGSRMIRPA